MSCDRAILARAGCHEVCQPRRQPEYSSQVTTESPVGASWRRARASERHNTLVARRSASRDARTSDGEAIRTHCHPYNLHSTPPRPESDVLTIDPARPLRRPRS